MKKVFDYFSPKTKQNLFSEQKTKAFIVIALAGILINIVSFVQNILLPNRNSQTSIYIAIAMMLFIVVNLFLLKKTSIKLVGNIFTTGTVIILAILVSLINENSSIILKFAGGFYTLFGIFSLSVLFASRRMLLINAIIIFATTTRVFIFAYTHYPRAN